MNHVSYNYMRFTSVSLDVSRWHVREVEWGVPLGQLLLHPLNTHRNFISMKVNR